MGHKYRYLTKAIDYVALSTDDFIYMTLQCTWVSPTCAYIKHHQYTVCAIEIHILTDQLTIVTCIMSSLNGRLVLK